MSDHQVNGDGDETAREKSLATLAAITEQHGDETWVRTTLLPTIGKFVGMQVRPLQDEIAKLKAQVAALEEGGVKFCGSFQRGNEYQRGQLVSFDGALWCAVADTKPLEIPGKASCWQLAVRAGRDAPRLPTSGRPT